MSVIAKRASSPVDVAARLWPGPDPIDFLKREAIAFLEAHETALRAANLLRRRAYETLMPELDQLWIHQTQTEKFLALELSNLRLAARNLEDTINLLGAAHVENDLRNLEARSREREEGRDV